VSFFVTPLKRLRFLRAACALFLAAVFFGCSLLPAVTAWGRIACYAMAGGCVLYALLFLHLARRTPRDRTIGKDPRTLPLADRIRSHRKAKFVSLVAFPALSALTAWQLYGVEFAGEPETRIWAPLALIYNHLGYWPAVLAPLIVGVVAHETAAYQLRAAMREAQEAEPV
jgi:hypothetical protein